MSRPEQAARVHDRAARQDDPGDSDPRPGEQQPQEEWGQQGGQQVCINNLNLQTSGGKCKHVPALAFEVKLEYLYFGIILVYGLSYALLDRK